MVSSSYPLPSSNWKTDGRTLLDQCSRALTRWPRFRTLGTGSAPALGISTPQILTESFAQEALLKARAYECSDQKYCDCTDHDGPITQHDACCDQFAEHGGVDRMP